MKYRVQTNDEGLPVTVWFNTKEAATAVCAQMNVDAHRRGEGGLYGVYDSDGGRAW